MPSKQQDNCFELRITRYNVAKILGVAGVVIGFIGALLVYFSPTWQGYLFLVIGLVGGGVAITNAGPFRTIEVKHIRVNDLD